MNLDRSNVSFRHKDAACQIPRHQVSDFFIKWDGGNGPLGLATNYTAPITLPNFLETSVFLVYIYVFNLEAILNINVHYMHKL